MTVRPSVAASAELHAIDALLARVCDKWAVLVVVALGAEPLRFNDLQRSIPLLSGKMLITTLRRLQAAGLVTQVTGRSGLARAYALSAAGRELRPVLEAVTAWAQRHATAELAATAHAAE